MIPSDLRSTARVDRYLLVLDTQFTMRMDRCARFGTTRRRSPRACRSEPVLIQSHQLMQTQEFPPSSHASKTCEAKAEVSRHYVRRP